MDLASAITTAIDFEGKVYRVYAGAVERSTDPTGRRVFQILADEEKQHLDYLGSRLREWNKTGRIQVEELATSIPPKELIVEKTRQLQEHVQQPAVETELEMLQQALAVETETSQFYERMVQELSDEGQQMFARFVEIEQGHRAIVQAEIDAITGTGHWFDIREFDLEAGG